MNWLKDKKQRSVIIISVAILLCSLLLIPLSRKADNFPHDIWSNLILLMSMAGGGGIGAVISIQIMSRRNKHKSVTRQNIYANRLKKKAWTDFRFVCAMMVVVPLMYGFMTYANIKGTQGATYLLISLGSLALGFGSLFFLNAGKSQRTHRPEFDEREFHLIQKAINIGNNIFICYTLLVMTTAFFIIGGRGMVPMWTIPVALFTGFFLAGSIQFLVLLRYAKEDERNIEGGAA